MEMLRESKDPLSLTILADYMDLMLALNEKSVYQVRDDLRKKQGRDPQKELATEAAEKQKVDISL
jgi:adenylate kinase